MSPSDGVRTNVAALQRGCYEHSAYGANHQRRFSKELPLFQIDYTESRKARSADNARPVDALTPASEMPERRAILSWAEHCIECAAPACYTTCDLYSPTSSGKCRRFDHGIIAHTDDSGIVVEVAFREWGKLEAQGNAVLLPSTMADRIERWLYPIMALADRTGRLLAMVTGRNAWRLAPEALFKRLNAWLVKRQAQSPRPSSLDVDIENLGDASVAMVLTGMIDRARMSQGIPAEQLPPPAIVRIDLEPGRTQARHSMAALIPIIESGLPFNLALAPADGSNPRLRIHRLDLIGTDSASTAPQSKMRVAPPSTPAKLVVFDLDNTLWDGVLLEGDIRLREGVKDLFRTLDERGILLSIASKNAREDAMRQLAAFGLDEYLLHPQIGWLPKSQGISQIVRTLDIGIDSVIFVDDNPFERNEVSEVHSVVEVLSDTALVDLEKHPRLQGAITDESRVRRSMYRDAIAREDAQQGFGDDYLEFLRSCSIEVEIREPREEDFERIAELVQRTNQLNFSGRKYDRAAIGEILSGPRDKLALISCCDKFGSYGKVGFCIWDVEDEDPSTLLIRDFMLSCRVQGKFVEQALIARLLELAGPEIERVRVDFHRTDRNRAAQLVLEKLGFKPSSNGDFTVIVPADRFALNIFAITEMQE